MKKLGLLVMPLMAVSFLASCGGSKPGPSPTTYNVTYNKEDIVLDNVTATEGVNYSTTVRLVDSKKEKYLLTDNVLEEIEITINDKALTENEYEYRPANDMTTAQLEIDAQFITGNINIYIPVIENLDEYYIVDFDSNGGSYVKPILVKDHGYAQEPTSPQREHFVFKYWYLKDSKRVKFDFKNTRITDNIRLIAYWENNPSYYVRFNFTGFMCKIENQSIYSEDIEIGDESKPNIKSYEITTTNEAKLPEEDKVQIENENITYRKITNNLAYLTVTPKKDVTVPYDVNIVATSTNYAMVIIQTENCKIGYSSYIAEVLETNATIEYVVTPAPNYTLPETVTVETEAPSHEWFSYDQKTGKIVLSPLKANIYVKVEAYSPAKKVWNAFHSENVKTRFEDEIGFSEDFAKEYEIGKKVDICIYSDHTLLTSNDAKFYINGIFVQYDESSTEIYEWKDCGNGKYLIEYTVPEFYQDVKVSNIFVDIENHVTMNLTINNELGDEYRLKLDNEKVMQQGENTVSIPVEYTEVYLNFTVFEYNAEKEIYVPCTSLAFDVRNLSDYEQMDFHYHESKDETEYSVLLVRPTESFSISGVEKK